MLIERVLLRFKYVAKYGISSLFRPAGRERAGGVSGAKMKTNKSASIPITHFDATVCADMDCRATLAMTIDFVIARSASDAAIAITNL